MFFLASFVAKQQTQMLSANGLTMVDPSDARAFFCLFLTKRGSGKLIIVLTIMLGLDPQLYMDCYDCFTPIKEP